MIWKLQRFLLLHWRWYAHMKLYVIADATDNSVTFSRHLFRLLDVMDEADAKVYVTQLCNVTGLLGYWSGPLYAFCINPPIGQDTQLADIQYNTKHRCVGFESLCPTVARITFDYGIMPLRRVKLSVTPCTMTIHDGTVMKYYAILPPKQSRHD
jgi:hypothetical protein